MERRNKHHQSQQARRATRIQARGLGYVRRTPKPVVGRSSGGVAVVPIHRTEVLVMARANSIFGRAIKRLDDWATRGAAWWRSNDHRYGVRWRAANAFTALLLLVSIIVPIFTEQSREASYSLTRARDLLTATPDYLRSKLTYDTEKQLWHFNKNAADELPGVSGDAAKVGGVTYSAQLPTTLTKVSKVTLTDAQSKIDMAMVPQFSLDQGKKTDGHVVYPLQTQKGQLIYSFHSEGVKEDIVLYQSPGDKAEYAYKLEIPAGLEARLQPDGSVGIFGGDKTLFGNLSYGSDSDRELVEKARRNSQKNTLYYVIPAPVITGDMTSKAKAEFKLQDNTLTVKVSGLKHASYPLSIDPSFIMNTSGCAWQTAGNNEGNVDYAGCQLGRSKSSGATLGSWGNAGGTTFTPSRMNASAVVSNGYVYLMGGDSSNGSVVVNTNTVNYAPITTSGTIGAWNTTTSLPDVKDSNNTAQAYNGYIYLMAGTQGSSQESNNVWYAAVCTGSNITTAFATNCSKSSTPGTVTSWATANTGASFTSRTFTSSAVYNGYMYVVGGCSTTTGAACSTTALQDVNYAKINGDGTLGAWTSVAGTYGVRYLQSSIAYNGYLYVIGGCTAQNGLHNCSTTGSDVWYTALDSSTGAPGTWTQSPNTLASATMSATVGVSNGYLYIAGGCTQTTAGPTCNAIAPLTTVATAQLYGNGGVGVWQTTTSLSTGRSRATGFAYSGYMFVISGCTNNATNCNSGGGTQADSLSAQISTTVGNTSSFGTTTNYYDGSNPARLGFASVAYGGFIYILGGTTDNHGGITNMVNTARYAAINPDGTLGSWSTSSTGFNNQTTESGRQCTGAGNCPGRTNPVAGGYNGYIYIAGGWSNQSGAGGTVNWSDVQSAVVCTGVNAPVSGCAGAGDLRSWTTVSQNFVTNGSYATANGLASMGMQIYNGRMYLVGGENDAATGTESAKIYYASLDGGGASALTFTTSTVDLPAAKSVVKTFVSNGRLYAVGGGIGGTWLGETNNTCAINFIPIKTDGSLDGTVGWKDANAVINGGSGSSFATNLDTYQVSTSNGYVYITGGQSTATGPATTTTKVAKILSNGALGSWSAITMPSLGSARYFHAGMVVNGFLYAIGGCNNRSGIIGTSCSSTTGMQLSSEYAQIYNGGGGSPNAWSLSTNTTSTPHMRSVTVVVNDYIYAISGCNSWTTFPSSGCGGLTGTVAYAKIDASTGDVGGWSNTTGGVTARQLFTGFSYNGYIYILGGCTVVGCGSTTLTIQYGKPDATGNVTSWSTNPTNLPSGMDRDLGAVAVGGRVYVFNGNTGASYYTTINTSNGQINGGSWVSGPAMPTTYNSDSTTIATNGKYIYLLGHDNALGDQATVQYIPVNSDGSLGSWKYGPSLERYRKDGYVTAISNGYLYVTAGYDPLTPAQLNDTLFAPIFSDGSIGNWQSGPRLGAVRALVSGVIYKGYFYVVGGLAGATPKSDFYWAPLQATPNVSRHSMLLVTDKNTNPANFYMNNATQSGSSNISLNYRTAASTGAVFGSLGAATNTATATKYPVGITGDGVKYYWLNIVLDDAQSMTFDESTGSTVSYFQLNYHANPSMRLRGGKTFNQNVQQSLDAQ